MKKKHFDGNPKWEGIREQIYGGHGIIKINCGGE